MSTDKRTVHTDALDTLGKIIDETCKRDAIHIAVEPCIAAEILYPGQHVGIIDGKATTKANKKLGIVDPFINGFVPEEKMFWLIIYPRTITSLRHVWEHPDFIEQTQTKELSETQKSWNWINDFADKLQQHPHKLMQAANNWLDSGEYTYDNSETYKDYWNEFETFWEHYEIVTGKKVPDKESSFFTCSC